MRKLSWALLAAAAASGMAAQERAASPPNVLLLTVDALRADRLTERLTPTLWRVAARGVRFERAYAHAPLTLPSHASILTGLVPPGHGVRNNGFRLDESVVTLAELLQTGGYRTGAFVGASALDARFGLGQGFEHFDDNYDVAQGATQFGQRLRDAGTVLDATAKWLATQRQPWFVWSHLRDPHAPYVSYDRSVAAMDAAVAAFLAKPHVRALLDRTIIVVTADHGESLGEHGERTHGVFAYEGVLRVPLFLAGPGLPQRAVASPSVGHADIAPTVLELAGVETRAFDGRSLRAAWAGGTLGEQRIYFEALDAALMRGGAPLTGVVAGRWKYIDLPIPELYDVVADPAEQSNRVDAEAVVTRTLRDATIAVRTRGTRADAAGTLAEPEARARLRSLGYVGSASWRLGASRPEDDPKRLLPVYKVYESAIELAATDADGAIAQLRLILQQRPDFAAAVDALGALLLARGKPKEAVALLTEARAGGLRHRILAERLAAALLATRDARSAAAVLAPIVEADGAAVDARFLLARALRATGNVTGARAHLVAALKIDPTFPAASALLERLEDR